MHQNSLSGNRKPKSGAADLPGMRFVHAVESFKDLALIFGRYSDSGILQIRTVAEVAFCISGESAGESDRERDGKEEKSRTAANRQASTRLRLSESLRFPACFIRHSSRIDGKTCPFSS